METKNYLFPSREEYLAFKAAWSKLAKEKKIDATMILFYNIARGKDLKRGFTPIQRPTKLANGATADQAFESAKHRLNYMATDRSHWNEANLKQFVDQFGGTIGQSFIVSDVKNRLQEST